MSTHLVEKHRRAEATVPCRLVIESDENRGMIFPLRDPSISIGRGPQNTIQIIDTRMSRMHARLEFQGGSWTITDLQSKNGVFVNGQNIVGIVRLTPGDQVHIGSTTFTFEPDLLGAIDPITGASDTSVKLIEDDESELETSHVMELPAEDDGRGFAGVQSVPQAHEERLRSIYQIGKLIQSILDLDELLNKVMEIVCQVLHPTQACIMLYDKRQRALVPKAFHRPFGSTSDIIISGSVIHQAMEDRVAVLMSDGARDEPFAKSDSIVANQIVSAICVPLIAKGEVLGALYLDLRGPSVFYNNADLEWAAGVAGQAALAIGISLLHADLISTHEQEREIQIARTIQMNLLPKSMPRIKGFELGGLSEPARQVGGDYFDIIELADSNYSLTIADVSGKGIPSALLLAAFRAAARAEVRNLNRDTMLEIVDQLNETICRDSMNNMFIAAVMGYFEPESRRLTYCNCGHVYPILQLPNGDLQNLETGGSFLGIMPAMSYEVASVVLPPGSRIVFVTDGVTDALNPQGEPFGTERLIEFMQAHPGLSAQEFCDQLEEAILAFRGEAEQFDDLTIMVLKAV